MAMYRPRNVLVHAEVWEPGNGAEGVTERTEGQSIVGQLATRNGFISVGPGDFVVTGPDGGRYPMKPDAFRAMFEEIAE